ncbi:MAG: hypothetical protein IPQ18_10180 [Saprospiraceae bacterium]|nr:hypothetical protein [Saprospiraceae bacterium]
MFIENNQMITDGGNYKKSMNITTEKLSDRSHRYRSSSYVQKAAIAYCRGKDADVTHPTTGAVRSNRLFLDLIFGLLLYQDKSDRKLGDYKLL